MTTPADTAWEILHAPYDPATYRAALRHIQPGDVLLDIGAGDLRFARQAAELAQKIYAIEIAPQLVSQAIEQNLPANLTPLCADARTCPFPPDVTTGILLMRHCTHFQLYAEKLRACGAKKLITNARWRMDIEAIDLTALRTPYHQLPFGWYACWCGATGFKPGPAEKITHQLIQTTFEVTHCPHCSPQFN